MWSGASNAIPSGWYLCDGNNNTPDLRNRFIVGAGSSYEVGATGGSDTVTLTIDQIPSHGHAASGLSCTSSGSHTHTVETGGSSGENGIRRVGTSANCENWKSFSNCLRVTSSGSHTHSISGSISNTGGGHAHENRPPYYALCFIMKA